MANVSFQVAKPDDVEITMALTLRLKDWRMFVELVEKHQLGATYPLNSLYVDVRRALDEVSRPVERRLQLPEGEP